VERVLSVSTALDGNGFVLTAIADRGNGISPDAADRLFEPFLTTKPHGLGLGLSICRSIVAASRCRCTLESRAERR
jgi:two-component system sensor kinase FixL